MNREAWLTEATSQVQRLIFNKPAYALPRKLAVSVGIPAGSVRAIGQCWDPRVSTDGTTHVFICPSLDKPIEVLGTLVHELVHAVVGVQEGHKGEFIRMARAVGLRGKPTATVVEPGTQLHDRLELIFKSIGEYPHRALKKSRDKPKNRPKRIKLISPGNSDYAVTIGEDVFIAHGVPVDPWGEPLVPLKPGDDS